MRPIGKERDYNKNDKKITGYLRSGSGWDFKGIKRFIPISGKTRSLMEKN